MDKVKNNKLTRVLKTVASVIVCFYLSALIFCFYWSVKADFSVKRTITQAFSDSIETAFINWPKNIGTGIADVFKLTGASVRYVTGREYVKGADGTTIVKFEDGNFYSPTKHKSDDEIYEYAGKIRELYEYCAGKGTGFLYVCCPNKNYDVEFPHGIVNYTTSNVNRFANDLNDFEIPLLDLQICKEKDGITTEEMFFITDHHWKPDIGFWADRYISDELGSRYGYEYDDKYLNLDNYNIRTVRDSFRGKYLRLAKCKFIKFECDDFDVITPKFETDFICECPFTDEYRTGSFEDSVLYMQYVKNEDVYKYYRTYCDGDKRLQIITNNKNPDGPVFVIIRDSYGCVTVPYLAMNASKIYLVDNRDDYDKQGPKQDVYKLIDEVNPDYLLMIFRGVPAGNQGALAFYGENEK